MLRSWTAFKKHIYAHSIGHHRAQQHRCNCNKTPSSLEIFFSRLVLAEKFEKFSASRNRGMSYRWVGKLHFYDTPLSFGDNEKCADLNLETLPETNSQNLNHHYTQRGSLKVANRNHDSPEILKMFSLVRRTFVVGAHTTESAALCMRKKNAGTTYNFRRRNQLLSIIFRISIY